MDADNAPRSTPFEATGKALVFSAPSGAGKTTLVRRLMADRADVAFSVSATNRSPRGTERDGVDYHFLTTEAFQERVDRGEFLEWEEVYDGRLYGTLREAVEQVWKAGQHVVFDVDVEGGIRLKEILGDHIRSVFVSPPSLEVLEHRLRLRATDSEEDIVRRLAKAERELGRAAHFDVILVNDDLETACGDLTKLAEEFLGPERVEA
jgi:guanylate kinase